MLSRPLTYLAVPYTGQEEFSFKMSCAIAARLMDDGELIFSPISHSHPIHHYMVDFAHDHEFWMEYNIGMMERCQKMYILTLSGWDKSPGVKFETKWFWAENRPVYLLSVDVDNGKIYKRRYYQGSNKKILTEQMTIFDKQGLTK